MGLRVPLPGLAALALILAGPAAAFETNGRHWPGMPIPYWVNPAGAPDFGDGSTVEQVVAAATAAWAGAPCATVSFAFQGTTDGTWAPDGRNTIYFVTSGWGFGKSAAGATLWRPTLEGEPMEVDLALNAADLKWVAGGGDATKSDVVDPRSVITHELGHWLGLAHSADAFATMYQALLPSGMQATLGGDDLAGICTLYPNGQAGCAADADCGTGRACVEIAGVKVCDKVHDPAGAPCDKGHLNCAGMCFISLYECSSVCAFTALDYSSGYCAPLCDGNGGGCPDGWACNPIPGQAEKKVCLVEPPQPDGLGADEAVDVADVADEAPDPGGIEVAQDDVAADARTETGRAPDPDPADVPSAPGDAEPEPAGVDAGPVADGGSGGCATGRARHPLALLFLGALCLAVLRRRGKGARALPRHSLDATPRLP